MNQVPPEFQSASNDLTALLATFQAQISAGWDGAKSDCLFSAECLAANDSNGINLANDAPLPHNPSALDIAKLNVDRLADLGAKSITVSVGCPILIKNFYVWANLDLGLHARIVTFYMGVSNYARSKHLKIIVETAFATFSPVGLDTSGYLATLSDLAFKQAWIQNAESVIAVMKPDYITVGGEPDTYLNMVGRPGVFGDAASWGKAVADAMKYIKAYVHRSGVLPVPMLGAGVGSWQSHGSDWLTALLAAGIDFADIHAFPVNGKLLSPNLADYADQVTAAGKQVGISQAWLWKLGNAEPFTLSHDLLFARDCFSFWTPLDSAFLTAMVEFCHWKKVAYLSPFWTKYFFNYLDWEVAGSKYDAGDYRGVQADESKAVGLNLWAHGPITDTGRAYQSALI